MKNIFWAIVGLVLTVAAIVFLMMFGFGVGVFAENVKAKYNKTVLKPKITQTIYQPDNALAIYARFRNDCQGVIALNEQIGNLDARFKTLNAAATSGNDPLGTKLQAAVDALNDLTGAKNQRANVAADYNSRSTNFSQVVFKNLGGDNDPELPYRITPPYNIDCG